MDGRARSASSVQPSARGSHRRAAKSPTELTNDLTKLLGRAAGAVTAVPQQPTPPEIVPGRHHADPPPPLPAPPEPTRFRFGRPQLLAAAGIVAAATVAVPLLLIWAPGAEATGTAITPASRGHACRAGTPNRDLFQACRAAAAIRTATDEALGDGTDVSIPDVGERHREVIPDTRLCSAGRERYRGLDLARDDWPTTVVPSEGTTTFEYRLDDRHSGRLRFFLTRAGYDPKQPLTWEDLEPKPIGQVTGKPGTDNAYRVRVRLPKRSGTHVVYTIWEREDTDAALYACSDVRFGRAGENRIPGDDDAATPAAPAAPAVRPTGATVSPSSARPSDAAPNGGDPNTDEPTPAWESGIAYDVDDLVEFDGVTYRCLQPHRSVPGWEPESAPALWEVA
ncbi:lytic polysaccharide monooxygenase [Cryptosporangium minutisporangium]|uniref:Chitin-binding type-3 domain-containing protein n=1 Tax=Cryptosporangium minutisporangium TaxID=113569 RepID=A0ABP6T700_9ACTN